MTEPNNKQNFFFIGLLPKLRNYFFAATILCYSIGFAITNLYLGSMGILTFDLLRSRYILTGLLFLFYSGAIIYLTKGLIKTLRKYLDKSPLAILWEVIWYSLLHIGLLSIAIRALGILAGTTGSQKFFPHQITQPEIPWADWFSQAPLSTFRSASGLFAVVMLAGLLMFIVYIVVNPKDKEGNREPRRKILADAYRKTKESKGKILLPLLGGFALLYLFFLSTSLLSFYVAGEFSTTKGSTSTSYENLDQLFLAILIVYAVILAYLMMTFFNPPIQTGFESIDQSEYYFPIYLIAIGIITIVPLYILRVYPEMPQQIGGGRLVKVEIILSDSNIEPQFSDPEVTTYLIDKTSTTSFFMLQMHDELEYKIIEINSAFIQSITYTQSP